MKISVINNPSVTKIKTFKKFWGSNKDYEDENDPSINFFDKPDIAIVANNENLIGMLYLYFREIMFDGSMVKLAGVGGVVTHKDHRHQGVATTLLSTAHEVMEKKECDIAILCTDIEKLGKLYTTIGFVPLGRSYYFEDKNGKESEETGGMIAPIVSTKLFNKILSSNNKLYVGKSNF